MSYQKSNCIVIGNNAAAPILFFTHPKITKKIKTDQGEKFPMFGYIPVRGEDYYEAYVEIKLRRGWPVMNTLRGNRRLQAEVTAIAQLIIDIDGITEEDREALIARHPLLQRGIWSRSTSDNPENPLRRNHWSLPVEGGPMELTPAEIKAVYTQAQREIATATDKVADISCKDASRLLYGAKGKGYKISGGYITREEVRALLDRYNQAEDEKRAEKEAAKQRVKKIIGEQNFGGVSMTADGEISLKDFACALDKLPDVLQGNASSSYNQWLGFCASVVRYFGNDGLSLLKSKWPTDDIEYKVRDLVERNDESISPVATIISTFKQNGVKIRVKRPKVERPTYRGLLDWVKPETKVTKISLAYLTQNRNQSGKLANLIDQSSRRVVLLVSPKGSAKTDIVAQYAQQRNSGLTFTHRVNLALEQARRFGFENYIELKDDSDQNAMNNADKIALCVDSVVNFDKIKTREFLFVDESESLLAHIATSDTLKDKRVKVWDAFRHALAQTTGKIVFADADANFLTYSFLVNEFGAENIEIIYNDYKRADLPTITACASETETRDLIIKAARDTSKPIFVATNSKNKARDIAQSVRDLVPEANVLDITAYNSGDKGIKAMLSDLGAAVVEQGITCLIVSPTVDCGVDISIEYFDTTFVLGYHGSTTSMNLLQQMWRNRKAKQIFAYVVGGHTSEPTDLDFWHNYCFQKHLETGLPTEWKEGELVIDERHRKFLQLYGDVRANEKMSTNHLSYNFYAQAQREGHTIRLSGELALNEETIESMGLHELVDVSQEQATVEAAGGVLIDLEARLLNAETYKEAKEERKERELELVVTAVTLDRYDVEKLQEKTNPTEEEQAQIKRYYIADFYGVEPTRELIVEDKDGTLRKQITAFMFYSGQLDAKKTDEESRNNSNLFMSEWKNEVAKAQLTREIINRSDITEALSAETGQFNWFVASDLVKNGWVDWVIEHKDYIYTQTGMQVPENIGKMAIKFLSGFLKRIGLSLEKEAFGPKDNRQYRYRLNAAALDRMMDYAEARKKLLDKREEERREQEAKMSAFDRMLRQTRPLVEVEEDDGEPVAWQWSMFKMDNLAVAV